MKLDFKYKDDNYHRYCIHCHHDITHVQQADPAFYECEQCGQRHERSVVIDPTIEWWVDQDKEYWHESAGVFIEDGKGRFLFFERAIFPFALTVPSGHVDKGETANVAAKREVEEETGITLASLREVAVDDIWGDQCRRGADVHRWHAFVAQTPSTFTLELNHEGLRPAWLTLDEAMALHPIVPVRYMIEHYGSSISSLL